LDAVSEPGLWKRLSKSLKGPDGRDDDRDELARPREQPDETKDSDECQYWINDFRHCQQTNTDA